MCNPSSNNTSSVLDCQEMTHDFKSGLDRRYTVGNKLDYNPRRTIPDLSVSTTVQHFLGIFKNGSFYVATGDEITVLLLFSQQPLLKPAVTNKPAV